MTVTGMMVVEDSVSKEVSVKVGVVGMGRSSARRLLKRAEVNSEVKVKLWQLLPGDDFAAGHLVNEDRGCSIGSGRR